MTLITAVPGGGKTAYAVWYEIKKAHEQQRIIYTVGIPQLKIPTIELTYDKLKEWYVRDESQELPQLQNIDKGALIVVDEVQKLWPATGTKISDDIKDLSEHRHFGLSFVLITQSPTLIHRNVLALIDRHLHIRPNWSGRKIYEWPEYQRNPAAQTNKNVAVISNYKLPTESFDLYHSSSQHIKPKKKIPIGFYLFVLILLALPVLIYLAYDRVISKTKQPNDVEQINELSQTNRNYDGSQTNENVSSPVIHVTDNYPTLLTKSIDWERVGSCLSSEVRGCICYGKSGERLVIEPATCKLATQYGWTSKDYSIPSGLEPIQPKEKEPESEITHSYVELKTL